MSLWPLYLGYFSFYLSVLNQCLFDPRHISPATSWCFNLPNESTVLMSKLCHEKQSISTCVVCRLTWNLSFVCLFALFTIVSTKLDSNSWCHTWSSNENRSSYGFKMLCLIHDFPITPILRNLHWLAVREQIYFKIISLLARWNFWILRNLHGLAVCEPVYFKIFSLQARGPLWLGMQRMAPKVLSICMHGPTGRLRSSHELPF